MDCSILDRSYNHIYYTYNMDIL